MLRMMTLEPTGNLNAGGAVKAPGRPVARLRSLDMFATMERVGAHFSERLISKNLLTRQIREICRQLTMF